MSGCRVCRKPRPDAAVAEADPFCSRACACAHFGTETPKREMTMSGYDTGGHGRQGAHGRMLEPHKGPLTGLQRARLEVDRRARLREGIRASK